MFTILSRWRGMLGAILLCTIALCTQIAGVKAEGLAQNAPLCRFGVNSAHSGNEKISDFDIASLRIGWYIDYTATANPIRPNGINYSPMIRLMQINPLSTMGVLTYTYSPSGQALLDAISSNPGADWMIGNEPDRRYFQDDMLPSLYATAFHELSLLIKSKDPTAKLFAGSIVQATPVRLKYLDLVLRSYWQQYGTTMPVDGWSIHNFILNEVSCAYYPNTQICWGAEIPPGVDDAKGLEITVNDNDRFDLFVEQIVRFRQWMASRGYRNTPLYLSEYGILMPQEYGFPNSRVNQFMTKTFDFLLSTKNAATGYLPDGNRLVQRLSWYSTNDNKNFNGWLFEKGTQDSSYHLSAMGQNYVNYTQQITTTEDIIPLAISISPSAPLSGTGPVTFTIAAKIANSGNNLAATTINVRFFDADPAKGGHQIGADQSVSLSGCGETTTASVIWKNVAEKSYTVFVQIDPENLIAEGNQGEQNNLIQQTIFFATDSVYLPIISRIFAP